MIAPERVDWKAAIVSMRSLRFAREIALALALFGASHAVYRSSTGTVQLCDSTYSLAVSEAFLNHGTLDLSSCIPADASEREKLPGYRPVNGLPYHLVYLPNPRDSAAPPRVLYGYPLGSSLLSLPFVQYYRTRGLTILGPDGIPSYAIEGVVQTRIAARVCAAIVLLIYLLARFYCSPVVATLVAASFAIGSPVWSTLSRSLWSHTWMVFWVSVAVVLLVGLRRVAGRTWKIDLAFGLGLGTSLFWAAFCRQHAVVSAAAIGVYLLLHERRVVAITVLSGGAWASVLVAASLTYFGSAMPPSVYASNVIDGHDVLNRLAWLMVSPARGLIVYCPYLVVVLAMLVRYRRYLRDAGLLLPAGLACIGHTALLANYNGWHANWAYGPRYYTDILPWFALLTAMAVGALQTYAGRGNGDSLLSRRTLRASTALWSLALAITFGWGVFVHYRGANSEPAWMWNDLTRTLGDEGAVKDWRHPQFLAGLTFEVKPDGSIVEK